VQMYGFFLNLQIFWRVFSFYFLRIHILRGYCTVFHRFEDSSPRQLGNNYRRWHHATRYPPPASTPSRWHWRSWNPFVMALTLICIEIVKYHDSLCECFTAYRG
jgi:hypothetical protein